MNKGELIGAAGLTLGLGLITNQQVISANRVNDYIFAQKYKKLPTQNKVNSWLNHPNWLGADMQYRHGKPEGVVVHETANPSDKYSDNAIWNEINYMLNHADSAFVHSFVDANNVVAIADPSYKSWGSGAEGNRRFIQTEQTEVNSKDAFAREIWNLANLQADYLHQFGLKPALGKTVWSHAMVSRNLGGTDHTDPDGYWANSASQFFGSTYTMNDYEQLLEKVYDSQYTAKYHVGQRVQVLNTAIYETNGNSIVNRRGRIGTVKKVTRKDYSNSHFEYVIDFGHGVTNQHIAEQDITDKIIYHAKYHVGQKVQLLDSAIYETNGHSIVDRRGKVGTIKKVTGKNYSHSHFEYYVAWDDGTQANYYVAEQDLTNKIVNYKAKYHVGQQVQVLNTAIYETNGNSIVDKRNKVGTVKKVTRRDYSNSHFEYYIAWNDGTQASYYIAEQDLTNKIVNYKAKYHVGQRVQVLNTAIYETNGNRIVDKRGKTGTVKKVTRKDYSNSHFEYYVAWDDGSQANYYMAEQDLTDHIKAYQAKFKVGQRVQVLNTAIYETNGNRIVDKRGKTGTVKKVTRKDYSYSHYEYYVAWDDGSQANYYMAEQDLKASAQRRLSLENEQPKDASSAGSNSAQATSASDATNTISSQNAVTYKNGQQVFVKVNRDGRKETRIGMIVGVKPGAQGEAYQVQFVDGSILNNVFANDLLAR